MLAACAAVKAMLGVTTAAAAFERIVWPLSYDDEAHAEYLSRPRIVLSHAGDYVATAVDIAAFAITGRVLVLLEKPAYQRWDLWPENFWAENFWPVEFWPSQEITIVDRELDALNVFGEIIDQLQQKSRQSPAGDYINVPVGVAYAEIKRVVQTNKVGLSVPSESDGDYFSFAEFAVELG